MCSTERHYRVNRLLQKQEVYFGKASHFRFALKEIIILNRLPSVETLSFLVWICSTELDRNFKWVQNCRTLRKCVIYDFRVYEGRDCSRHCTVKKRLSHIHLYPRRNVLPPLSACLVLFPASNKEVGCLWIECSKL